MKKNNKNTRTAVQLSFRENDSRAWALIACAIFMLRSTIWFMAELWHDEVLTLQYFAIGNADSSFLGIFRNYVMANNHFLNSAIYWWWVRFLDFNLTEHILRWPSLFFALASILLITLHWRKFIGRSLAAIFAVLFAISPVFTAFAYQIRGYSMAMFFSFLALSGVLELIYGNRARGQLLLCVSCFLLPLVMPSAVLLAPALALFLFWQLKADGKPWSKAFASAFPCLAMSILSGLYYLSIWEQFRRAGMEAGGWESSWLCAGHLFLALIAHLGLLSIPMLLCLPVAIKDTFKGKSSKVNTALRLSICACLPIAIVLLLRFGGRAPFPRIFLIFLPVFSLSAALCIYSLPFIRKQKLSYIIVFVLLSACVIEVFSQRLTVKQVRAGAAPQNLLQQYYRGATDNRDAILFLRNENLAFDHLILVNEWDAPSFSFYWHLSNLPQQNVFVANRVPDNFWQSSQLSELPLLVFARNEIEATMLFKKAGHQGRFYILHKTELRNLYAPGYAMEQEDNRSDFINTSKNDAL